MPPLDLKINGDCASAVNALTLTERAVGSLQTRAGSGVGVAVSVIGARAAQKDLAGVAVAMNSTNAAAAGLRNGGGVAAPLGAGAVAARGLTSSLAGTNRAMNDARVGAGAMAVAGAASTRSMGAMVPVVAGMTSRLTAMNRAATTAAALPAPIPGGRAGGASILAAAHGMDRFRTALAAQQLQAARGLPVMAMANAQTSALASNATAAAGAMTRLQPPRDPFNGRYIEKNPGYLGSLWQGLREGAAQTLRPKPDGGGPPPIIPPTGGGRGGDGAGDEQEEERRGAAAGRAGAEVGKGIGTMLMAGLAIGIATNASYAKHAIDAVNATISETPGLADKAKEAADELGAGIRDITQGADLSKFADSFERLGTAQRALGQVQGQIGMQNLGTKLEAEARSADAQTRALINMAPAFDAAIRGSNNLETALLKGISNPQVVNGVRALGESLSKPEIAKGLADITTGATGAALVWGKVATDIAGAASKVVNAVVGADNVTDMSGAVFGGAAAAALSKGGLGSKMGAGILGGSAVYGSQDLMARGKDELVTPSIINELLGAGAGYRMGSMIRPGLGVPGMIAGGLAGQYGTEAAANAFGPAGPGALTGAQIGLLIGSAGGPMGMAAGAAAGGAIGGAVGTVTDEKATWAEKGTSLFGGTTFGDVFSGGAVSKGAGENLGKIMPPGAPGTGGPGPVVPGPKKEAAGKGLTWRLEELQGKADATRGRVAEEQQARKQQRFEQEARAGTGYPAGTPLPNQAPATAVQQLDQNAQRATQSVQGLGAAMPQVAQQVQALPAAFAPIQQLPQQASTQMQTAATMISGSASQVGASIPPAISTGIVKQTPQVCDSAANMGASMVNCTAKALLSASPSQKFVKLGESTGEGAKIGVDNSAGGAVDAVGNMTTGMLGAVGALGSGVAAVAGEAVPIAQSGGLMVGYVWARSMQTGVDTVLKQSDFMAASMPNIDSALAKTTLGQLGFLGPAGSGASVGKSAKGGIITMTPPAPSVNATIIVSVDGTPLRVMAQEVVDTAFGEAADSYDRQRG